MLYGGGLEEELEEEGLAAEIQRLTDEKVRIAKELTECMDGIKSEKQSSLVRLNRLEAALFDLNEKVT